MAVCAVSAAVESKETVSARHQRCWRPRAASRLVARVAHREPRPSKSRGVVAAHFWNPPQLIPLVEVCAGPETDPWVVPWLIGVLRRVGKQPGCPGT